MHEQLQRRRSPSACTRFKRAQKGLTTSRPPSPLRTGSMSLASSISTASRQPQNCSRFQRAAGGRQRSANSSPEPERPISTGNNCTPVTRRKRPLYECDHPGAVSCEEVASDLLIGRRIYYFWSNESTKSQQSYEEAMNFPPVSAGSLRELELNCIMNNARLRHDINFDRELHFRPNLDGERGTEKSRLATAYWDAIGVELRLFAFLLQDQSLQTARWTSKWIQRFRQSQRRLPNLFSSMRDILVRLMPEGEQQLLTETFDIEFIMQQIEHGVFDLSGFAARLGTLLKAHCAPMRDKLVDDMVDTVAAETGEAGGDGLVTGLRNLFGVLEAMKLDVANHQIRYMRPTLVENTISFEQTYFANKVDSGLIDLNVAMKWYMPRQIAGTNTSVAALTSRPPDTDSIPTMDSLATCLVYAVIPPPLAQASSLPDTFRLDVERLRTLVFDTTNLVYIAICHELLKVLLDYERVDFADAEAIRAQLNEFLSSTATANAGESRWFTRINNIAIETAKLIDCNLPSTERESKPRHGITDVVNARYDYAIRYLDANFRRTSPVFARKSLEVREEILKRVHSLTTEHHKKSSLAIFEALTPVKNLASTRASSPQACLEAVSRRLAHVCILHWRVWSPVICTTLANQSTPCTDVSSPRNAVPDDEIAGPVDRMAAQDDRQAVNESISIDTGPTEIVSSTQPPSSSSSSSSI